MFLKPASHFREQTGQTKSDVFKFCRFSLFLMDQFSRLLECVCVFVLNVPPTAKVIWR